MARAGVWDSQTTVATGIYPEWGKWHISKETEVKLYSPITSYLMNKKWWLQEEFADHLMRLQQVSFDHLDKQTSRITPKARSKSEGG